MPIYALVDCNNFYVSCERLFRPDLRETPIVVLSNNDGCIISRSAEAKALGVAMGEPYFKMRELVEPHGIQVFSSNYALYGDVSARVMNALREMAPRVEVYSIDESFLDLTGLGKPLAAYGRHIRGEVQRLVGMPVCVGISTTKTLSKLANWAAKRFTQSGVVVATRPEQQSALLKEASLGEVWGIGCKLQQSLGALGIVTAWDLAQQDARGVGEHLGSVERIADRNLQDAHALDRNGQELSLLSRRLGLLSQRFSVSN